MHSQVEGSAKPLAEALAEALAEVAVGEQAGRGTWARLRRRVTRKWIASCVVRNVLERETEHFLWLRTARVARGARAHELAPSLNIDVNDIDRYSRTIHAGLPTTTSRGHGTSTGGLDRTVNATAVGHRGLCIT